LSAAEQQEQHGTSCEQPVPCSLQGTVEDLVLFGQPCGTLELLSSVRNAVIASAGDAPLVAV
jgi:hypothetical protein